MSQFNKSMTFEFVKESYEAIGYSVPGHPRFIGDTDKQGLILDHIEEDLGELKRSIANKDLEGIIVALGNLDFAVNEAALRFGINLPLLSGYIHESKMSRVGYSDLHAAQLGKERYAERGIRTEIAELNGLYFLYEGKNGKILENPNFKEPDIHAFIEESTNA